ncbi:MAG: YiaA/YiaB family inner membrane protein [Burkholderiales bacterium]|jgi:hypothetical protein
MFDTAIRTNETRVTGEYVMSSTTKNTGAWLTFTYIFFSFAVGMMVLGIWAIPADLWIKGYLSMATVSMLGAAFTLAKTVRDEQEAKRFSNRIEDAKAERLLMEVGRVSSGA